MVFRQETITKIQNASTQTHSHSSGAGAANIIVKTKKKNDGTTEITELDPFAASTAARNNAKNSLEARKQPTAEVNWLGSSYSGQDIKIVAHLYGSIFEGINQREEQLNDDLATWEFIKQGTSGLLSATTLEEIGRTANTFEERRGAIDSAVGLGDSRPERRAKAEINKIINTNQLKTAVGRARLKTKLIALNNLTKSVVASARDQLAKIGRQRVNAKSTLNLGSIQTLSVQTHREKFGVRALGHSYVKGYTRGPRTIAGSMIFTLFDEHPLKKLITAMGQREAIWRDPEISTLIPDQLPPIDLTLVFANEYGSISRMSIYGVEFLNDGVTFSVDDLMSEAVLQFVARDVDIMTNAGFVKLTQLNRGMGEEGQDLTATSLIAGNDAYNTYLDSLKIRRRSVNR